MSCAATVLVLVLTAAEAVAQKYPERRETRFGTKAYVAGDFAGAEARYRSALEFNPELDEARFNLGNALWKQEKGEEAAGIFMEMAADSLAAPDLLAAANFNSGNVMLAGQKIEEAIEFYKQSLRVDPTDMQAKYNLAYARKLLQNQQNQDQNQDQDQQDQNQDRQNDREDQGDGNDDRNQDRQDGEGKQDENEGDNNEEQNDGGNDDQNQDQQAGRDESRDGDEPPKPEGSGRREATIDPHDAEQMLEAMQDEEDKTREKMNAKEVPAVGRSGKNW